MKHTIILLCFKPFFFYIDESLFKRDNFYFQTFLFWYLVYKLLAISLKPNLTQCNTNTLITTYFIINWNLKFSWSSHRERYLNDIISYSNIESIYIILMFNVFLCSSFYVDLTLKSLCLKYRKKMVLMESFWRRCFVSLKFWSILTVSLFHLSLVCSK